MLSPEILNRLPSAAFWAVISVFLIGTAWGLLSRVLGGSKAAENGLLGPLGRWFKHRTADRKKQWQRDIREAIDSPDYKALYRRIDNLEKLVRKLEAEIIKLEIVEEASAVREDMNAEFLREDAHWHIEASLQAAEQGYEMPTHRSYSRFCRDYREKHGMQYGRRWNDDSDNPDQYRSS